MMDSIDFVVDRRDLGRTTFVHGRDAADAALVRWQPRVDRFAFTVNNSTYAALGEAMP